MTTYVSFISLRKSQSFLAQRTYDVLPKVFSRYLFSSESHQYLKGSEANYTIADTCLKYLSSDCFDSELSNEAISEGIIRGTYVLQDYAAAYWLEHILRGSNDHKKSRCLEGVSRHVEEMIERRKNPTWEGSYIGRAPVTGLKVWEEIAPEAFEILVDIHPFLQRRWREFSLADGK